MTSSQSEESLLLAARQGDRAALGQLLVRHAGDLSRRLSARMPRSLQRVCSVDDVLQQTFAEAFRDIAVFEPRGPGSFAAWLETIGQRRLQNMIKSAGRLKRGGERSGFDPPPNAVASVRDLLAQVAGDDPTASVEAVRLERVAALNVALGELPEDYREALRLRFFEGCSLTETARRMERTEAAVRALTDRAKRALREALACLSSREECP